MRNGTPTNFTNGRAAARGWFLVHPPCDNRIELLQALEGSEIPFVRLSPQDRRLAYPHVRVQDYEGAAGMTQYLIGLGHTRIGFIMGTAAHSVSHERLRGFRDTLKKCKLKFDSRLVCQGDWTFASGMTCASAQRAREPRPTAVSASNDDMAAGVLYVAHQHGIRVPRQLTVTGFDDVPLAQQIYPALTTVHQPILRLAQLGTQLLVDLIQKNPVTSNQYDLPTHVTHVILNGVKNLSLCGGDSSQKRLRMTIPAYGELPTQLVVRASSAAAAPTKFPRSGRAALPRAPHSTDSDLV